jgi:hypothetical protein
MQRLRACAPHVACNSYLPSSYLPLCVSSAFDRRPYPRHMLRALSLWTSVPGVRSGSAPTRFAREFLRASRSPSNRATIFSWITKTKQILSERLGLADNDKATSIDEGIIRPDTDSRHALLYGPELRTCTRLLRSLPSASRRHAVRR